MSEHMARAAKDPLIITIWGLLLVLEEAFSVIVKTDGSFAALV